MDFKRKLLASGIIKPGNRLLREVWKLSSHNIVKKNQLVSPEWVRSFDGTRWFVPQTCYVDVGHAILPCRGRNTTQYGRRETLG